MTIPILTRLIKIPNTNPSTMAVNTGSVFNLTAATPVAWTVSNNTSFNANVNITNGNDFTGSNLVIGAAGNSTATVSGAAAAREVAGARP